MILASLYCLIPKGLLIAICGGMVTCVAFGLVFANFQNVNQLEYTTGESLSIITDKLDFKKGEIINIRVINSGTIPLRFSDPSYGLQITQLDNIVIYSWVSTMPAETVLQPRDEIVFSWNQLKDNGEMVLEGTYRIVSHSFSASDSMAINIHK